MIDYIENPPKMPSVTSKSQPWECPDSHLLMFCVIQLRRMQEMIAKMQAQMQKQGDGEGEGQHVWNWW